MMKTKRSNLIQTNSIVDRTISKICRKIFEKMFFANFNRVQMILKIFRTTKTQMQITTKLFRFQMQNFYDITLKNNSNSILT